MDNIKYIEEGMGEEKYIDERKKVFLIGDSIREGYCPFVKEYLKEQVEVAFPNDNCRDTHYVLTSLRSWVTMFKDPSKVSIVTFNCGHWDVAHWNCDEESLTTEKDYARNLKRIIAQLQTFFPLAKIVFFTTTPMSTSYNEFMVNPRSNTEIEAYNAIACKVMSEQKVKVCDLFKEVKTYSESCFKDYCHLTEEYNVKLGNYIAGILKQMINK